MKALKLLQLELSPEDVKEALEDFLEKRLQGSKYDEIVVLLKSRLWDWDFGEEGKIIIDIDGIGEVEELE